MSQINVDKVAARTGGAPTFPSGLNLVGVTTGLSVSGVATVSGSLKATDSTTSTSTSTGALIVTGGVGVGKSVYIGEDLIVAGNVTGLGTVTWEDVTNQDVLGLSTFRAGLHVGPVGGIGVTVVGSDALLAGVVTATTFIGAVTGNVTGNASGSSGSCTGNSVTATNASGLTGTPNILVGMSSATGISTFAGGVYFNGGGALKEKVNIVANKLSAVPIINLDNGMTHYFTTTETTTSLPNIRSSVGINTALSTGDTISVTIITTAAAAGYSATWAIDDVSTGITTSWVGGSAPTAGGSSGLDTYALTIIKTGASANTIINNVVNSA